MNAPRQRPRRGRGGGGRTSPTANGGRAPEGGNAEAGARQSPAKPARLPRLIAHRGYAARFPENSLSGVRAALEAGFTLIELDIQLTADLEPVLFHDLELDRVCGVPGKVTDVDAAQLAALRAGEPARFGRQRYAEEPLARLSDCVALLAEHPEVQLFLEIKAESTRAFGPQAVLDEVLKVIQPVHAQCVLISFCLEVLALAREQSELHVGAVLREWEEREESLLKRIRPEYVFCDVRGLPDQGRLHVEGATLAVFELSSADTAIRLANRGVELIESFDPGELAKEFSAPRKGRGGRGGRGSRGQGQGAGGGNEG